MSDPTALAAGFLLAALCASLVVWHARPWVKPPTLTVTITMDITPFEKAVQKAIAAFTELGETMARIRFRIEPDPNPFPQFRLFTLRRKAKR